MLGEGDVPYKSDKVDCHIISPLLVNNPFKRVLKRSLKVSLRHIFP